MQLKALLGPVATNPVHTQAIAPKAITATQCRSLVRNRLIHQTLLVMKLTAVLLTVFLLSARAEGIGQTVTFSGKQISLQKAFTAIKSQTGFVVFYDYSLIDKAKPFNIQAVNLPLESFLQKILDGQQLEYAFEGRTIIISPEKKTTTVVAPVHLSVQTERQVITGNVRTEEGVALPGVSVTIKGTSQGTVTDASGYFTLQAEAGQTIVFSYVGFDAQEVKAGTASTLTITLKAASTALDESVVIGYGTATRRTHTGSVSTVKAKDIAAQPVGDPLAALQGRVAGFFITSSNGLPGSSFNVMLRGKNSILGGTDPLYIIDGVPFYSESLNQFNSANGSQSPLATINPSDIERIDVLKDADATTIYGSRGANGVVLITTKQGKAGKTQFNFNVYSGGSRVVNKLDMLNTPQYLQMRKEAFANDNVAMTNANAADLLLWDQNKTTNWQDFMIGHTASVTEAQGSVSGGNAQTNFLLSATYRRETTVLPNDLAFKRGAVHLNVNHSSVNGRFNISASLNYSSAKDNSIASDITSFYNLAPNYPIYDTAGKYYWYINEQNPQAYLLRRSNVRTNNLVANSIIRYTILPGFDAKVNLGYTRTTMDQTQVYPNLSLNPLTSTGSFTYFGNGETNSWVIEPQLTYKRNIAKGVLQLLAGATWQHSLRQGRGTTAENFSSDALLDNISSAGKLTARPTTYNMYRYNSGFARATYNWDEKYIVNATFRRDGSTRFGAGKRFGNFASAGAAWVFTNESFLSGSNVLSFGKLRTSYGTSGSDQIGDYSYLDSWSSVPYAYDGVPGLSPSRIANNNYHWEENQKLELALELGFFNNRILLNTNLYRNVSGNQLIGFSLSPQTGFDSYAANLPATVVNKGVEVELNTVNIRNKDFSWKSSFNITFNKNTLKKYPDFDNSPYTSTFAIGQSLSVVYGYQYTGIDANGKAQFLDKDNNGNYTDPDDLVVIGKTMPDFFGGLQNTFSYKGFELDFLLQFVQQEGPGVNYGYLSNTYGYIKNKDISALNRWQKSGDIVGVPKATLTASNANYDQYRLSSAVWGDASYIRLKNISVRYNLSKYVQRYKINGLSVYLLGQNLLTLTSYDGFDPETQGLAMPPLKTLTAGIQLSF